MLNDIDMSPVINRIHDGYRKTIDCESGWWEIIRDLDSKLSKIDPSYIIYQVKEKFGSLRFYYEPSHPRFAEEMRKAVDYACSIADSTCEKTGRPGQLMIRDEPFGTFKTLSEEFNGNGWTPTKQYRSNNI